jgi:hypothetical protein
MLVLLVLLLLLLLVVVVVVLLLLLLLLLLQADACHACVRQHLTGHRRARGCNSSRSWLGIHCCPHCIWQGVAVGEPCYAQQ